MLKGANTSPPATNNCSSTYLQSGENSIDLNDHPGCRVESSQVGQSLPATITPSAVNPGVVILPPPAEHHESEHSPSNFVQFTPSFYGVTFAEGVSCPAIVLDQQQHQVPNMLTLPTPHSSFDHHHAEPSQLVPQDLPKTTQKENLAIISLNKISSLPNYTSNQQHPTTTNSTNQKQYSSSVAVKENLSGVNNHNIGQNMVIECHGNEKPLVLNSEQHNSPVQHDGTSQYREPCYAHHHPPPLLHGCYSSMAPHTAYTMIDQAGSTPFQHHQQINCTMHPRYTTEGIVHSQHSPFRMVESSFNNESNNENIHGMYDATTLSMDGNMHKESLSHTYNLQQIHYPSPLSLAQPTSISSLQRNASSLLPLGNSTNLASDNFSKENGMNLRELPHHYSEESKLPQHLEESTSKVKQTSSIPPIGMLKATSIGKKVNGRYTKLRKQLRSFGGDFTDNYFVLDIAATTASASNVTFKNAANDGTTMPSMPPSKITKKHKYDLSNTASHHILSTEPQQRERKTSSRSVAAGRSKQKSNPTTLMNNFELTTHSIQQQQHIPIIPSSPQHHDSSSRKIFSHASSDIMNEMCPSPSTSSYLYHSQSLHQIPPFISSPQQSNPSQPFSSSTPQPYVPYSSMPAADLVNRPPTSILPDVHGSLKDATHSESIQTTMESQHQHLQPSMSSTIRQQVVPIHHSIYRLNETVATQYDENHHRHMSDYYSSIRTQNRTSCVNTTFESNERHEETSQALLNFLVTLNSSNATTQVMDEQLGISSMLMSQKESNHPQQQSSTNSALTLVDHPRNPSRTSSSLIEQIDLMPPEDKSLYLSMLLNELKEQNSNK
ncbi:hypothetical protein C9374_003729 [Naegleria lovaniensis]|uniref:Uncharacterized protein n=1 Tax=Naegleria lovaniensis TaxID=51637 RepID=A0AA88GZS3_NAELO|nr:uncharacterized protein C9374_003729 [Naegleria lovaniensis]KAG2393965.1 hypothetical protein C9374_003729 [Naegleria lovaniensis]